MTTTVSVNNCFSSMATCVPSSIPLYTFNKLPPRRFVAPIAATRASFPIVATPTPANEAVARRSGNYKPGIWDDDYLQSLTSVYVGEPFKSRAKKLMENVRIMLNEVSDPLDQLKLIDDLQRLGLSYHFEDEIGTILKSIHVNRNGNNSQWKEEDLYDTALEFRLLRQHGFHVPQEVFNSLKDEMGNFKASLCKDTKGMLCLYEASFLLIKGENIIEEARDFATRYLVESLQQNMDPYVAMQVSHALEVPLHWRMPRLQTRWFIENVYERRHNMNPVLLAFAKLDYNMVQAIHQEDLKHVSRWWRRIALGEKLSFARDRVVECFLWTAGITFEPQYGYCRRNLAKVNALITEIDDVYDVYGTLDELELFTDAVERWEINAMEHLPDYLKILFLALYNSVNEVAYEVLKEQDTYILPQLKKGWAELCKAYFTEAKWYHGGYAPTLEEYFDTAWLSIAAPLMLLNVYFTMKKPITKEALECLLDRSDTTVIHGAAMILRLADDLGTSSDELSRGDVPKSIQCYMHETGASEEDARQYVRNLISETWKKINEDRLENSPFSQTFFRSALNLGRMAQCMYQHGDGHGVPDGVTKDRILSLFVEPIPL